MNRLSFLFWPYAVRSLCSAVLTVGGGDAFTEISGQLQINQVADAPPSLTVFITADQAPAPRGSEPTAVNGGYAAALGSLSLPVKSAAPFDQSQGLTLVVALDVSASLGAANFSAMKQALVSALSKLPPKSQVALMAIGSDVKTVHGFTTNFADIVTAADAMAPNAPETALYEAVIAAQEMAAKAGADLPLRRAVLVITDGIDDSRRGFGREEALQKIAVGDVPLLAVALAGSSPPTSQREAIKSLAQISRASGGEFNQTVATGAKTAVDTLLAQAFKVQVLNLDCSACQRDGAVRRLQVSLQQGNASATDSRDVRLLSIATVQASAVSGSASASKSNPAASTPVNAEKIDKMWIWGGALLLVFVVVGVLLLIKRRTASPPIDYDDLEPEFPPDDDRSGPRWLPETDGPTIRATGAVSPRKVILDVAGKGQIAVFLGQEVVIGRSKSADVALTGDIEASSKHASLSEQEGVVMLSDKGSSNGTFLNGSKITRPEPVNDRDCILVGRTEIRVYLESV